jgi:L-fuculose-phosphate aldolase
MPAARASTDIRRAAIVAAGRRLGARGLIAAGEGNLSIRLGEDLLITPSGRRKDELSVGDLLVVTMSGAGRAPAGGSRMRPSSDLAIHLAVYASRPDVLSVVHAHLPAAMALTLAGEVPDPNMLPETALLLPHVPFVPFAAAGSDELAAAIAKAFAEKPEPLPGAAILERHGAVAVGSEADGVASLDQAIDRLELLEVLCRTWRDALLVRGALMGGGGPTMLRPPSPRPGSPARGRSRRQP